MARITTLFWDIGGVVLTNGWDRSSRKEAGEAFHLDWDDFQDRHAPSSSAILRARPATSLTSCAA